ncbi:glycosyl hydrolase family 8 [Roseomonas elaeocarpi]|uniref:cellulase n=1 Tax=Roseomonas elaeocarpi TaxID=907779 RepID=A0ABV6JUU6_9PROT
MGFQNNWQRFAARFLAQDGRIVDTGNDGVSHSEGQGWGMLFALRAGDQDSFERIYAWTRRYLRRPTDRLHAWRWTPSAQGVPDDFNNATDGDIFIAAALCEAGSRWNRAEWRDSGRLIAQDILRLLLRRVGGRIILLPGEKGFEREAGIVANPSYYAFPMIRTLAAALPDPLWIDVVSDGLHLIRAACLGPAALPADWVTVSRRDGSVDAAADWPERFSYDAVRVPLWLYWSGMSEEPGLLGPEALWRASARHLPAWVNLRTAQVSPYAAPPGIEAVARLVSGDAPGRGGNAVAPLLTDTMDYYSSALILLTQMAADER